MIRDFWVKNYLSIRDKGVSSVDHAKIGCDSRDWRLHTICAHQR